MNHEQFTKILIEFGIVKGDHLRGGWPRKRGPLPDVNYICALTTITLGCRSVQVIMERSFNDEIKSRTVNAEDPVWQEIRDQLFLITMTDGIRIKGIYDSLWVAL